MPKQKQRTSATKDFGTQTWKLKANTRPYSDNTPIELFEVLDENGQPIDIYNNIKKVKNILLSKDVYKEFAQSKDTIGAITFTKGHHPSTPGFWTGQAIAILSAVAGIGSNVFTYLRLVPDTPQAPYNPTKEDYEKYQEALKNYKEETDRYLVASLVTGVVTAVAIYGVYFLNQYRVQQGEIKLEHYELINSLIDRLENVPKEIDLKENTLNKIQRFLQKDHQYTNFSLNFAISETALSDHNPKWAFWHHRKVFAKLPDKFLDCITAVLEREDDLGLYQGIHQTLSQLDTKQLIGTTLDLMKIQLKEVCRRREPSPANIEGFNRMGVNNISSIYILILASRGFSDDDNRNKEISEFLLRSMVMILGNTRKLLIINRLMDFLKQASNNANIHSDGIELLSEILDIKENANEASLDIIVANLNKIDNRNKINNFTIEANFIQGINNLLANKNGKLGKVWNKVIKILEDDLTFREFLETGNFPTLAAQQPISRGVYRA